MEQLPPEGMTTPEDIRLREKYKISAGDTVTLRKESIASGATSDIKTGETIHGTLSDVIYVGSPIVFDEGGNTRSVQKIYEDRDGLVIETRTSRYRLVDTGSSTNIDALESAGSTERIRKDYLDHTDLAAKQREFDSKGFGEWDQMRGRVPLEDSAYYRLLEDGGFEDGDTVTYWNGDEEREGTIRKDKEGMFVIVDTKNKMPQGIQAVFFDNRAFIKRKTD